MEVFKEYQISGTPDQVAGLGDRISDGTPPGWSHSRRFEAIVGGTYDIFGRRATAEVPDVNVALFTKNGASNAKIVNINPTRGSLTIKQYNQVLREFSEFATPIAEALGMRADETSEQADITRWISSEAANALLGFSNAANKSTGSAHPLDFDRWVRFIIRVHREGSELSTYILQRYLCEVLGWGEEIAQNLVLQYEFGLALLAANDSIA